MMNSNESAYLSSVEQQNFRCQINMTNDFSSSSSVDHDFLSPFSPSALPSSSIDSFQTPFFDEGGVLDSSSPFSAYNNDDTFIDVMSPPVGLSSSTSTFVQKEGQEEEIRRQRLARKAELARANRKRKKQVNDNNDSNNSNIQDEGDSDSSSSGSRSPSCPSYASSSDYSDMSMSPGPQPTNWDGGFDEEEDVRRKRLARKAELARVSRKKKKDRIEELEAQLTQMQNELNIARQMFTTGGGAIKTEPVCKPEIMEQQYHNSQPVAISYPPSQQINVATADRLNRAMGDFANPNYLGAFYSAFIDKVREDMTQIDQLQTSMQSSLCLRFVQWIMNQNDKFYADPCGLWYSLFSQEVGASSTQLLQLLELRKEFPQNVSISGPDIVSQAFDALRKAMDDSSRLMAAFAQIFSPTQLTLFFQWVERFGPVCIKINL